MLMADRDRLMATAAAAEGSVTTVDNRQVDSSTHYHQTMVDANTQNQLVSLVQNNHAQFGAYMQQNNINQER